jgi:acetyl-CoA carboxylase biotin carboxyl carrier protein
MTFKEIQELIKLVNKTNLSELKLKNGDFKIQIRSKDYIKSKAVMSSDTPNIISMTPAVQSAPAVAAAPQPAGEALPKAAAEPATASNANLLEIKSPIVGTFYRSSSPDKPAFMKVGDKVEAGNVVCIVEAMKLFNEIESEISGTIVKVLVEDASPVEYDQPLFLVEPA